MKALVGTPRNGRSGIVGGSGAGVAATLNVNERTTTLLSVSCPHLCRWVAEFGTLEIGYRRETRSFIRALDEGGLVWKGRRSYRSLDDALADAETGIARWMREELGITDTV